MSLSEQVRSELTALARAYAAGTASIEAILDLEVAYCDLDLDIDQHLRRQLVFLSLCGNEYLMDLRPLADFDEMIEEVLQEAASSGAAEAAGG